MLHLEESTWYGIEWNGPNVYESEDAVTVPEVETTLTPDMWTRLTSTVLPLSQSKNYGIDLYNQALLSYIANLFLQLTKKTKTP